MKKYILVWLDGSITAVNDLSEIHEAYIETGNVVAIINANDQTYLSLDSEEYPLDSETGNWLPFPEPDHVPENVDA